MIKVEKNEEHISLVKLSIVFDEATDIELVDNYKSAIRDAIKCIAQDSETCNTYGEANYYLASLLDQMEYEDDSREYIFLCTQMNKKRLETLKKLPYTIQLAEAKAISGLSAEEQELKEMLFD